MGMTAKERVRLALEHKETDIPPFSWGFGMSYPAKEDLARHVKLPSVDALEPYLSAVDDCAWVNADYIGPKERNGYDSERVRTDVWGVRWKYQSFGAGGYEEMDGNPLAEIESEEEFDAYMLPSPDWWDYSTLRDKIAVINSAGEKAIKIGNGNIFETVTYMRGLENILMDIYINPELLHHMLRKVTDYYIGFFDRVLSAAQGEIDIVFTADDLGTQNGLMMSPEAIGEFIAPYHKELNELLHSYGVKVMYHSCGAVSEAVQALIDCGVDVLESLQFYTVGMDPVDLKARFGDGICFHGGVSVQKTLVTGSTQAVADEVEWLAGSLGKGGGYILAPAHIVQAGTPPENVMAMLAAAGRRLLPE